MDRPCFKLLITLFHDKILLIQTIIDIVFFLRYTLANKDEAVSETTRKRGGAYAGNVTYWRIYGNDYYKTQKPPPHKVSGFYIEV